MKIKILISVFIVTFLFTFIHSSSSSNLKNSMKTVTNLEISSKVKTYWTNLFSTPQATNCVGKTPTKLMAMDPYYFGQFKKGKGKFYWVKQWGFDNSAYLFDFIDPEMRKDVCAEFKLVYNEVFKLPTKNPKPKTKAKGVDPSLPFDPWRDPYELKKMNPKQASLIDFKIYEKSINTVQLNQAIDKYSWFKNPLVSNPGKKMVSDHDFNNDGRLSPREFIIAALRVNDRKLGSNECTLCFEKSIEKIDAIFEF